MLIYTWNQSNSVFTTVLGRLEDVRLDASESCFGLTAEPGQNRNRRVNIHRAGIEVRAMLGDTVARCRRD